MNRFFLLCIMCFSASASSFGQGQPPEAMAIEVYDEKTTPSTVTIYADNSSDSPISITLDFPEKKNITLSKDIPYTAVIPAKAQKHKVMDIAMAKGKAVSFQYGYGMVMGDTQNAKHDDSYVYQLPFESGREYNVGQGYMGRFSHQGTNAIDFDMDIGSKVCAARAGTVVFVKDDGKKSCKQESCSAHGNYIIILHEDGSFGRYVHLKYKGLAVKPGDKVKTGQVIAHSGNTGWSSGPHLHFEVYVPVPNGYITVPTKFKTKKGAAVYLEESVRYKN